MLLLRKSLLVAPAGEKCLILCFSKCVNELLYLPKLSKFSNALLRRNKLHWPRLICPTRLDGFHFFKISKYSTDTGKLSTCYLISVRPYM